MYLLIMWLFRYQLVLTDKRCWQELNHCRVYVSYNYYIIYYSTIIICVILDYPPDNLKWAVKPVNKGTDSKVVSVCVCVYAYVCVYVCTGMYLCVFVCMYLCMCVSVRLSVGLCTCLYVFVTLHICICEYYVFLWLL